jgi:hypothetical protein
VPHERARRVPRGNVHRPVDNVGVAGGNRGLVPGFGWERHVFPTRFPHVGRPDYAAGTGCSCRFPQCLLPTFFFPNQTVDAGGGPSEVPL